MSFRQPVLLTGKKAGADLSDKLHKVATLDASGDVVVAGAGAGLGFLMNKNSLGGFMEVAVEGGGARGIAGEAIAPMAELTANASGDLVAATSGQIVVALAMVSAATGDHFEVMVTRYTKA